MSAGKILVVDDENLIRKLLRDFLTRDGYEVLEAADGLEALTVFGENRDIDLIILDVMMPKLDGYETAKEIRAVSQVPIIMLTARSDERDELQGFDTGADEYVVKPVSPKTLVARVGALLRRTKGGARESILSMGGITLDKDAHTVEVDGQSIDLSFKEFELLTYFMENPGVALTREKILSSVWNYDYYGGDRTIDTHVKKLRAKLGDRGKYIETIWSVGYKFRVTD